MSTAHASLVSRLAAAIAGLHPQRVVRVAIDGVDGAGKTTLADLLAPIISGLGRPTVRASVDDFHLPRAARYARGRYSPDGYFLDSYNYESFRSLLLDPLGPGGSGQYSTRSFDLANDRAFDLEPLHAPPRAVLLVDGIFLHRPELRSYWDLSIFLKVDFTVSLPRGAQRDPVPGPADTAAPLNARYVEGQKRYLGECEPEKQADIVIDYNRLHQPIVLKWNASPG